jgi:uncharacterized protein (DUF2141 family)
MFVCLHGNLFSQEQKTGKIVIEIINIRSETGDVKISLHNQEDAFPGNHEKAVARIISDINGTTATAVFENIPYGEYAISIIHDENNNSKLDVNLVGMPKEGYGASNDAPAQMGPPKYKDAKFILDKSEINFTIRMVYFISS